MIRTVNFQTFSFLFYFKLYFFGGGGGGRLSWSFLKKMRECERHV